MREKATGIGRSRRTSLPNEERMNNVGSFLIIKMYSITIYITGGRKNRKKNKIDKPKDDDKKADNRRKLCRDKQEKKKILRTRKTYVEERGGRERGE